MGRERGWATLMGDVAGELGLGGWMRPGHVGDEGSKGSRWRDRRPSCLEVMKILGSGRGERQGRMIDTRTL